MGGRYQSAATDLIQLPGSLQTLADRSWPKKTSPNKKAPWQGATAMGREGVGEANLGESR